VVDLQDIGYCLLFILALVFVFVTIFVIAIVRVSVIVTFMIASQWEGQSAFGLRPHIHFFVLMFGPWFRSLVHYLGRGSFVVWPSSSSSPFTFNFRTCNNDGRSWFYQLFTDQCSIGQLVNGQT
jgi:hypothetical protein